jgi:16S rRNA (guanine1207-N2)-methyltransferase
VPSPQPGEGSHYFTADPTVASAPQTVELVLPEGRLVHLTTDRGTFSPDRIDPGTRLLLSEGPPVQAGGTLVDLGCGYGPVAIALALRGGPAATVWAVEVNQRARELALANARANGVGDQVRAIAPEEVPDDLVIDQLWSNPPIRIGKRELHVLLEAWLGRLRPGTGTATLVVQKHLGADSLAEWLRSSGFPTERTTSRAGYRLLQIEARS